MAWGIHAFDEQMDFKMLFMALELLENIEF